MKRGCSHSEESGVFSFLKAPLTSALFYREFRSGEWEKVLLVFPLLLSFAFIVMFMNVRGESQESWSFVECGVWNVIFPAFLFFLPVFALFSRGVADCRETEEVLKLTSRSGLQMSGCLWSVWGVRLVSLAGMSVPFVVLQTHLNGSDGITLGLFLVCMVTVSLCLTTISLWMSHFLFIVKILYAIVLFFVILYAIYFLCTEIFYKNAVAWQWLVVGSCFFLFLALAFLVQYARRFSAGRENISGTLRRVSAGLLIVPGICFLFPLWGSPVEKAVVNTSFFASFGAILFFFLLDAHVRGRSRLTESRFLEKGLSGRWQMIFLQGWPYGGLFLLIASLCFLFLYLAAQVFLLPLSDNEACLYSLVCFPLWAANALLAIMVFRRLIGQACGFVYVVILGLIFVLSYGEKNWFLSDDCLWNMMLGVIPLVNVIPSGMDLVRFCSILFFIIFVVLLYVRQLHSCWRGRPY